MAAAEYLAMTAAEMEGKSEFPFPAAWMACHFSPYGLGLSNLPRQLPPGSLLMLDDITPIHGHDPERIAQQLQNCAQALDCAGILLDFQRPGYEEAEALARYLAETLPCPVCVSDVYGQELPCPVLLPPVPCHVPLAEHLAPWAGREIWLEKSREGTIITLTEQGAEVTPLPWPDSGETGFREDRLHCHYRIETGDDARFTLWRSREDQEALLREAESLGVTCAVGLYQELGFGLCQQGVSFPSPQDVENQKVQ